MEHHVHLRYNLIRAPFGLPTADLVAAALEQVAWADDKGFHAIECSEHHGADSGYLPSPTTLSAALAACTNILRIHPTLIAPFYDPVRLAEDLCMLDNISNGRLDVTIIMGYLPSEFEMFGVSLKDRGPSTDLRLEVLRCAFDGRPFEFGGRRGRITPGPCSPGGPRLFIGGGVRATAIRAARYGDGYFPMSNSIDYSALYKETCAELGKTPGPILAESAANLFVTTDPERAWAMVAPFAMEFNNFYVNAAQSSAQDVPYENLTTTDELRRGGRYLVMTPEECIAYCRAEATQGKQVVVQPLLGGMPPDLSWESLELWANQVLPALREESR